MVVKMVLSSSSNPKKWAGEEDGIMKKIESSPQLPYTSLFLVCFLTTVVQLTGPNHLTARFFYDDRDLIRISFDAEIEAGRLDFLLI